MSRSWSYYRCDGMFWFRLFGYGLHFKDLRKFQLIFSERNRLRKSFRIGNWSIKFLSKDRGIALRNGYRFYDGEYYCKYDFENRYKIDGK